jgi:hypothetical protein
MGHRLVMSVFRLDPQAIDITEDQEGRPATAATTSRPGSSSVLFIYRGVKR